MVDGAFNLHTWEANRRQEGGVQGQPGFPSEPLSQNQNKAKDN